jgi:uncharacterized protein YggE
MARQLSAVVVAVLLVGAALGVGVTAAAGQAAANQATISVSGSGEVAAQPDQAIVFVSVTATAENASAAASQVAANVSALRTALDDSNLTSDVRTTDYSIRQQTAQDQFPGPPGQGDQQTVTYVARQSFAVTVRNVTESGSVIDVAVAAGATDVRGIQFTLSEERRRELRAEAIQRAVVDARFRAEAVAAATNLTLGSIQSVSVGGGNVFAERVQLAAADRDTVIQPREVTVSASVQVVYNATAN